MPRPRKPELIHCAHFKWRLTQRAGVWWADGRSNATDAGRQSLGTRDRDEALRALPELDLRRAEDLGLVPLSDRPDHKSKPLPLADGRKLYEAHIARPEVTGGTRKSTQKRYRTVFDKFLPFAADHNVEVWNCVNIPLLNDYAAHLQERSYADKTVKNELTTLKQAFRWFISAGHLKGLKPIDLPLRRVESEPAYCYRGEEIQAMV